MELFFTKYHGLGNDFIIVENDEVQTFDHVELAKTVCNRHTGIGADGLIIVKYRPLEMIFYNGDGSSAMMCGNGIRCLAHYLYASGVEATAYTVKTGAGDIPVKITAEEPFRVKINMGKPDFATSAIPVITDKTEFINEQVTIKGETFTLSALNMGIGHAIVMVDDLEKIDIEKTGSTLCHYTALFPDQINVNFVQIIDDKTLRIRTYERGVGPTLACGSGCCAAVVMTEKSGRTGKNVRVELELGALDIEVGDTVTMQGPAVKVYDGNISLNHLI
jgi:diaminopimelate epimerase